jgi:hypothetical protein
MQTRLSVSIDAINSTDELMQNGKTLMPLILLSLFVFGLTFFRAQNVFVCWAACFVSLGVILAIILTNLSDRLPSLCCVLLLATVIMFILLRSLPIYSLHIEGAERIDISEIGKDGGLSITNRQSLAQLEAFGRRGFYRTILKSGGRYHIYVWQDGTGRPFFVHWNGLGPMPGGFAQTVFCPSEQGLEDWIECEIGKAEGR